jgi:PadR family transcriptional regulator PadR
VSRKLSPGALKVLAFLAVADGPSYGYQMLRETGLKSGVLYPLLRRWEGAGWLVSSWEDLDAREAGRPRRRIYRLTEDGHQLARKVFA